MFVSKKKIYDHLKEEADIIHKINIEKARIASETLIFLDIDETILTFDKPLIEKYNKKYNKNIDYEIFRNREKHSLEENFNISKDEARSLVKEVFESDDFVNQDTLALSLEELWDINLYRFNVVFCSVFSEEFSQKRRISVDRFAPLVPIIRCEAGQNKTDLIKSLESDRKHLFLIDDNFSHLSEFSKIGKPIMVYHNYNRCHAEEIESMGGMVIHPEDVTSVVATLATGCWEGIF